MKFWYVILAVFMAMSTAQSADEKSWLRACEQDTDCTSVDSGCWRWQPVNQEFKYIESVKSLFTDCNESLMSGPQPTSRCIKQQCVNDPYVVRDWGRFDAGQKRAFLSQWVSQKVGSCLAAAGIDKRIYRATHYFEPYYSVVESFMRGQSFEPDKPLDQAAQSAISCEDVVSKAKAF